MAVSALPPLAGVEAVTAATAGGAVTLRNTAVPGTKHGWNFNIMATSFYLSRRSLRPSPQSGMPRWQDRMFILLARTANDATDYFQIPTGRVVEVGTQVTV